MPGVPPKCTSFSEFSGVIRVNLFFFAHFHCFHVGVSVRARIFVHFVGVVKFNVDVESNKYASKV